MGEVKQLAINFDNDKIVEEDIDEEESTPAKPVVKKCKHCVKIKSFKKDYISYCSKCGKILSLRHKKGEK